MTAKILLNIMKLKMKIKKLSLNHNHFKSQNIFQNHELIKKFFKTR